ncbi:Hypothetical predicted protein [Cloeon dipterum]|uniref:Uncharacterized protein n=1 Tax=Cloeon dipterum TaxID=197152 RepID=A0A8S1D3L2_9INSE|nr:Hypothetical predicted protein [Cloeon dipterum]
MLSQGAAAGPSSVIQENCLCCTESKSNLVQVRKIDGSGPKYICANCEVRERLTVAKLAEKIGSVDLTNKIKEIDIFKTFDIAGEIDVNNVFLGYLEFEISDVNSKEIPSNSTTKQHNVDKIKNESCKENYDPSHDIFFLNEIFMCPTMGCDEYFLLEHVEEFCAHIVKTHLWRRVPQISPPKKPKTAENQPDVVAEPSGSKKVCLYCFEHNTDVIIVREKLTVAKLMEKINKKNGIKVNLQSIRNMKFLQPYKIPEVSDVSDVTLGFWELEKCPICTNDVSRNVSIEKHIQANHPERGIVRHENSCETRCPHQGCKEVHKSRCAMITLHCSSFCSVQSRDVPCIIDLIKLDLFASTLWQSTQTDSHSISQNEVKCSRN